jgi:hypothetical protein
VLRLDRPQPALVILRDEVGFPHRDPSVRASGPRARRAGGAGGTPERSPVPTLHTRSKSRPPGRSDASSLFNGTLGLSVDDQAVAAATRLPPAHVRAREGYHPRRATSRDGAWSRSSRRQEALAVERLAQ